MNEQNTKLLTALREGVGLVQMLFYKELKERLALESPGREQMEVALLAGAITGEVFAAQNPDERFVQFREAHFAEIEQELLALRQKHPKMCQLVTDALRIQILCDYQENKDSAGLLLSAKKSGYLCDEREIPLPSSFMKKIREIGKEHNLVIPPVEITDQQDENLLH